MQDCYTGDIGDYSKLGLLRQLASTGLSIGVNWYRTPSENFGRLTGYLNDPAFRQCDPALCCALGRIVAADDRRVAALEEARLLDAVFFGDLLELASVTGRAAREARRQGWHRQALEQLRGCDLVFLDPDNGLMVPSAQGTRRSGKYVLPSELRDYYQAGASVIYYQHQARRKAEFYTGQLRALLASGGFEGAAGEALRFNRVSPRFYLFLMQPQHAPAL